jgi:hypothetical protein
VEVLAPNPVDAPKAGAEEAPKPPPANVEPPPKPVEVVDAPKPVLGVEPNNDVEEVLEGAAAPNGEELGTEDGTGCPFCAM